MHTQLYAELDTQMVCNPNGLPSVSLSHYQDNYSAATTATVSEYQQYSN